MKKESAEADLELAMQVAEAASTVTIAGWRAPVETARKRDGSVVTGTDLAAERTILHMLSEARPDDRIIAEESGYSGNLESRRIWIVDPLDQTTNFSRGLPEFATLLSLYAGNEAICAVISAPALQQTWWAFRGGGAHSSAGPLAVSSTDELTSALISIAAPHRFEGFGNTDPSLKAAPRTAQIHAFARKALATTGNGGFLAHMRVASGSVDVAVDPWGEVWDLAASALIVTEAGGTFTALDGSADIWSRSGIASNTKLHGVTVEYLRNSASQSNDRLMTHSNDDG